MKKRFLFAAVCSVLLGACGEAVPVTPVATVVASITATPPVVTATVESPTPTPIHEMVTSAATSTPGPVMDGQGNVSWHPQEVLITLERGGGDGVGFHYPPEFVLLWDGTLLQPGRDYLGPPYIAQLDQAEVCRILNTIDDSGFLDEPRDYNFPFDGYPSQYISVNSWKSNSSGSQLLDYALAGAPYYDGLFCRNCPLPSEETIIRPGLANVYFFLNNYVPENRKVAASDALEVYFVPTDEIPTHEWTITALSPAELGKKCDESYCYDAGMALDGDVAAEIEKEIRGDDVFQVESILNGTPFRVQYRVLWPYETSLMYYSSANESQWSAPPIDYTLTCNTNSEGYPILPLSKDHQYWYYSPDGKWGAEVVHQPEQPIRMRIVNKSGYEKYYQYDPAMFGQSALQVFPRLWTKDSEYFLVNILPGDFDPVASPFVDSIGLQRISISDGKLSYLFAGMEGQQYAYTLSENGRQAAFIRQGDEPLKITIKDTYSGREKTATLLPPVDGQGSYVDAGTLTWSVDESTLYLAATYRENGVNSGRLLAVDVDNPANQKIIYESASPFKLNQFSYHDWDAGICPMNADIESYCPTRLNLEEGTTKTY